MSRKDQVAILRKALDELLMTTAGAPSEIQTREWRHAQLYAAEALELTRGGDK